MRLSNEMNFPHPVLASWRDDFPDGEFDVEIEFDEDTRDGGVDLRFMGTLTSSAIEDLIASGSAMLGCFVTCKATGLRRLIELGSLPQTYKFKSGELLETVILRPIVWMHKDVVSWRPDGVHPEFDVEQSVKTGDIIAMADEFSITVAQADLPVLETIFDLKIADHLTQGEFEIDLRRERITILADRETKHLVDTLREMKGGAATSVMNGLYIPAIMTVLSELAAHGEDDFVGLRWYEPFNRRCKRLDIEPAIATAFSDAQRLLECPFLDLRKLTEAEYG